MIHPGPVKDVHRCGSVEGRMQSCELISIYKKADGIANKRSRRVAQQ